ncbi:MAG: hypothetical protein HYV09_37960, partial [Deltaproteobacteria bacterium]|nr:hypothetical protein [Deltaproteobacteria bacterium]
PPAPPSAVGGGPPAAAELVNRDDVALRVAAARCDRLQACGVIGVVSRHASKEVCLEAERARAVEAWDADACARIDATAAAACVDAARVSSCDTMFEPLFVPLIGGCAASTVCPTEPAASP